MGGFYLLRGGAGKGMKLTKNLKRGLLGTLNRKKHLNTINGKIGEEGKKGAQGSQSNQSFK